MSSFDQVLPGLFIGSYENACDLELINNAGITHIVTVASDLSPHFPEKLKYLIISALDNDSENLFDSFNSSYEFIQDALESQGKVLVHCLYGISRSSTIVISYLMKKNNWKYQEALNALRSCHPESNPNSNFTTQLLKLESFLFGTSLPYLCKTCRSELFTKSDLVEHSSTTSKKFNKNRGLNPSDCKSLFISKQDWMGPCSETSGRLDCLYCLSKLGDYNWAGRQCSCGKFVTPAFQIRLSSIDSQAVFESYVSRPKVWK